METETNTTIPFLERMCREMDKHGSHQGTIKISVPKPVMDSVSTDIQDYIQRNSSIIQTVGFSLSDNDVLSFVFLGFEFTITTS